MKNTLILLLTLILHTTIQAQITIIDIDNGIDILNVNDGEYYQDIQGFMDPFVGTWLYTNGNSSFKIVLTKNIMKYTGKYYYDYISGEYEYIENGITIRNTLNNSDPLNKGIRRGVSLLKSHYKPPCNDCPTNERRIRATIKDLDRDLTGSITLKLITVNGQEAIEAFIYGHNTYNFENNTKSPYDGMAIPRGTIIFIKQ